VKHFRAAILKRPDLRGVHYAIGDLLLKAGDYEKAEAEFRAELHLTPGSAAACYKLGLVLANRGLTNESLMQLRRANELAPNMPETLLELGKALAAAGDVKSSESVLRQVLAAERDSALAEAAHFHLAQVYRRLGRTADADRELKSFQQLRSRQSAKQSLK
jgi:tetratricopeptide (TPR) repeat protein